MAFIVKVDVNRYFIEFMRRGEPLIVPLGQYGIDTEIDILGSAGAAFRVVRAARAENEPALTVVKDGDTLVVHVGRYNESRLVFDVTPLRRVRFVDKPTTILPGLLILVGDGYLRVDVDTGKIRELGKFLRVGGTSKELRGLRLQVKVKDRKAEFTVSRCRDSGFGDKIGIYIKLVDIHTTKKFLETVEGLTFKLPLGYCLQLVGYTGDLPILAEALAELVRLNSA